MKKEVIIRAWKNPAFRASLSVEERVALPESPSGQPMTELDEFELREASGGRFQETARFICTRAGMCLPDTLDPNDPYNLGW